ncbi:hypothetical protein SLEP1_g36563 [Rubroshorea leprosula]|uniref:Uncharacterized protein n=1 Tax=Rubroshorea leprosula TaxID=152421 RepID=A0AAV5KRX3_9ROSI|nr:hypothetical protein SLEP1_g36563 [Rubroshorea leprosula]
MQTEEGVLVWCNYNFPFQWKRNSSIGGVQQQIAHQTHHDDTKTTNLDPILNQTSADEFRPNLDLTLAPPVVACEGNQAPTMGLFGTEAENFNPRIVLNLGKGLRFFGQKTEVGLFPSMLKTHPSGQPCSRSVDSAFYGGALPCSNSHPVSQDFNNYLC